MDASERLFMEPDCRMHSGRTIEVSVRKLTMKPMIQTLADALAKQGYETLTPVQDEVTNPAGLCANRLG